MIRYITQQGQNIQNKITPPKVQYTQALDTNNDNNHNDHDSIKTAAVTALPTHSPHNQQCLCVCQPAHMGTDADKTGDWREQQPPYAYLITIA